jgi:uncharacterized protein (DUF2236 family)
MGATAHQWIWRCSKRRRLPPAISPMRIATMMMGRTIVICFGCAAGLVRGQIVRRSPEQVQLRVGRYSCPMREDTGYFGPDSVSWHVHREVTVLFGGARAVLMQAAHPLVIAGARETGFYERNPWKRLQRTLILTYTITFGTKAEARAAADKINEVHSRIKGVDAVTGKPYDALDPELLLYVHACLMESALLFERLTVGRLDREGRERFHREQMLVAEMVGVPRSLIPPTVGELRGYLRNVEARGELLVTDAARKVAELFIDPPSDAEWRPVLRVVSKMAFWTLSPSLRDQYGVRYGARDRGVLQLSTEAMRAARPLLPPKYRFIAPYQEWLARQKGLELDAGVAAAKRKVGIRSNRSRAGNTTP